MCQNVIKSESKEVSKTEELTDTMDDLKSELKFYRYLLAEDLKHAPATALNNERNPERCGAVIEIS